MGGSHMKGLVFAGGVLALASIVSCTHPQERPGVVVNDVHSQLNETRVDRVMRPESVDAVQQVIREAKAGSKAVSIAGGRHAMGGQQFGTGTINVDMTGMKRVMQLDAATGLVDVQAGITWPDLIGELERLQSGKAPQWRIRQKQTGADRLTIGGALSANAHGRGLRFKPMIDADTHQLAEYVDDYHVELDKKLGPQGTGTEMISEVYVPRAALGVFMQEVAEDFRRTKANVIYGTIRVIEPDTESFLAWAKQRYASIIFNLHTSHDPQALEKTAGDFRILIDRALEHGGSYYLTYHHWATRPQVEAAYPQFVDFLKLKLKYDPNERFQSDWYRFYKTMFADALSERAGA
jgi:FAD/FMN-containing dehydrogenase